jgi:hypothetical protein
VKSYFLLFHLLFTIRSLSSSRLLTDKLPGINVMSSSTTISTTMTTIMTNLVSGDSASSAMSDKHPNSSIKPYPILDRPGISKTRPDPGLPKGICWDFCQGHCNYGAVCYYKHDVAIQKAYIEKKVAEARAKQRSNHNTATIKVCFQESLSQSRSSR